MPHQTLSEDEPLDHQPYLYIGDQNIAVRGFWQLVVSAWPLLLVLLVVFLCGLIGW